MDFALTVEQSLLRDSARRFLADHTEATRPGASSLWPEFAELGWLALALPEEHGGMGPRPSRLRSSPRSSAAISSSSRGSRRSCWPPALLARCRLAGAARRTPARNRRRHRSGWHWRISSRTPAAAFRMSQPRASRRDGWLLDGGKTAVIGADAASHLSGHRPHQRRGPRRTTGSRCSCCARDAAGADTRYPCARRWVCARHVASSATSR